MKTINGKWSLTLITLVTILCWSLVIAFKSDDFSIQPNHSLFFGPLTKLVSPRILLFVNYLLVLGTSFLLLWLDQVFSIIRTKTFLPFLFYTLFITTDPGSFFSLPGNLTTLILLAVIYQLFRSYQKEKNVEEAFNIGLLISAGSLFSTRILFFIPVIWIGLSYTRAFSRKSFFASIVGLLTPYWLTFCWFLYQKDISGFIEPFYHFFQVNPSSALEYEISGWIRVCFSLLITIFAVINFRMHSFKDKIKTRTYFYFILTLIIFVAILIIFNIIPVTEYAGIYYLSVSLFAAHFFVTVNSRLSAVFFYLSLITFIGLLFF
ncbi:MAG: hypothetical protein FWF54_10220 [Candidatus Azobacteroides sp.]|nr:hypothetical protein [Candidatus Azobacteroides sp.]